MRPIISTAITCLSMTAFSQAVDAQGSSGSQGGQAITLEEVVVTAQKREEKLQDVPISIAVVSGETLDKSSDTGVIDALSRVPGVFASVTSSNGRAGGNSSINIRGVSAATVGSAGTVAYYLDNVPFALAGSALVPDVNPYDLERLEVLRGPQGTLYGANALNGVVRILTKAPDFQDFEFKSRGSIQSTDHGSESYSADAAFNVPLIQDKLAARFTLGYQDLGGWIDKPLRLAGPEKDANDNEKSNVRLKLAAKLTENFSAGVSAWFSRADSGAPPFSNDGGRSIPTLYDEFTETDFDSYGLDLGYDTSVVSIKSASSYLDYRQHTNIAIVNGPATIFTDNRPDSDIYTEELVFSSVGSGPWRWTLGGMYRDAQDNTSSGQILVPTVTRGVSHTESKSTAVFGELTHLFADGRFELTGGLRYFRDKVRSWEDSRLNPAAFGPPSSPSTLRPERTFKKTTPRVVLTWHPSNDTTLYASYSQGYRSGQFQNFTILETFTSISPWMEPDTLKNYEIGAKGTTLNGRFTYDAAVFYIDWKDGQQDTRTIDPSSGGAVPILTNGEALRGFGVDLAVMYAPIDALTLGLNIGVSDVTFQKDVFNPETAPVGAAQQPVLEYPKGSHRANSPKTTAGANVAYTVPLGSNGYHGRFAVSANYVGKQIVGSKTVTSHIVPRPAPLPPLTVIDSYSLPEADATTQVRASFAVQAPKHWSATLSVDNLTNEDGRQPDAFSANGIYETYIRPRTYGLQVEYRY